MKATFLMILAWLANILQAQANILQTITPKITWNNIGIDVPTVVIFFETNFQTYGALTDPWLKISIPWFAFSLGSQWAMLPPGSCSTNNLVFSSTYEERTAADELYTTFYVQLKGATYTPKATYALKLNCDRFMDFTGYSDPMKIAFISKGVDGHVVFAYNNAFTNFYGVSTPPTELILTDLTEDKNRIRLNKIIDSYLIVAIKDQVGERLLIRASGDYAFADDTEIKCTTVADERSEIKEVPRDDYTCNFLQEVGGVNKKYLAFTWKKGKIAGGQYKLKFTLKTPIFGGTHSLIVYAMDRQGPRIHSMAKSERIFTTLPSAWSPGFPKIVFSFGLQASDQSLPLGLGLYSTSKGYNQVFNSLVFQFRASEPIPTIPNDESFELQIQLGSSLAIVPLGTVNHDLTPSLSKTKVLKSYVNGVLVFKDLTMFNGKIYTISMKVGYPEPENLSTEEKSGFGFISLIYKNNVIFKSRANYRPGFNKIFDNKNLVTNQWVALQDNTQLKRHRGVSSFRSFAGASTNVNDFLINTNKHGLRKGDGQNFFFQGSLGPNHMFYNSFLENGVHDSSKTFVEVITSKSISSKTTSWDDRFKTSNCQFYVSKYSKWMDQITITDAQNEVADPLNIITVPPVDYYFIGGCSYKEIVGSVSRYSRFRYRFDDKGFINQSGVNLFLQGVNFTLIHPNAINTPEGRRGNIFIWKNIDIGSYQSEINNGDSDSVILDAFILTYFFSSDAITDSDISATPGINIMDNMYVLGDTDTSWPVANIKFAPKLGWMFRDLTQVAPNLQISANFGENWPNVMHVHGTFGTVSSDTFIIKIFFDFIEPITKDKDSEVVDCSTKGFTVTKCQVFEGIKDMTTSRFRDSAQQAQIIYSYNSRHSYALMVFVDPATIVPGQQFSIVFPFKYTISTNINNANIALYNDALTATPSIVILDNTYSPLDYVDYGVNGFNFFVPVLHPSNYLTPTGPLTNFKMTNAQVTDLDGAAANTVNGSWFDITTATTKVGSFNSFRWITNCSPCDSFATNDLNFGATIMCGQWNFYQKATFNLAAIAASDNRRRCHWFKYTLFDTGLTIRYYFDGTQYSKASTDKYCMYCSDVTQVATPATQTVEFQVTDFTLPNYSGTIWPTDVHTAIGGTKINRYMQFFSLTKSFTPNLLGITSTDINIQRNLQSFRLNLAFTLTNPLPKDGSIYLEKQLPIMPFVLQILGSEQSPPCFARQTLPGGVTSFRCRYFFVNDGIQINLLEAIPSGPLEFRLYGVSAGDTNSPNIKFIVKSFLDDSRTVQKQIDQADVAFYVTLNYVAPSDPPSIVISNIVLNNWQKEAFGNLKFKVTLANRDLNQNDFLSINLGAGSIVENPELILCKITDLDETLIHEQISVCNVENLDDIKIQFGNDVTFKEFMIHLSYIQVPSFVQPGITATFKFNGDYTSFSSNQLGYSVASPIAFSPFSYPRLYQAPSLIMNLDGRGHRTDLILTITPNSPIGIYSILFLKFSPQFSPSLSNGQIFVFEVDQNADPKQTPTFKLQSWIHEPHTLAITGWKFSLDSKRPYTIKIIGVDAPGELGDRAIQVLIGTENGLLDPAGVTEWGQSKTTEGIEGSQTGMIYIQDVQYEKRIIRVRSNLFIDFQVDRKIGRYVYFGVWFDYLTNEVYRTFNPSCKLYKLDTALNKTMPHINSRGYITNCQILGHRLEMYLLDDFQVGETYRLLIDDMPNPDYGFCEPIPLRVVISNAIKTKTLLASSSFINNINKDPFTSNKGEKILNFLGQTNGEATVWRGFYDVVTIGPAAVNIGDRLFFQDQIAFALSFDLDGLFASIPIRYYGIQFFKSQIGESRSSFIIGSNTNTVTTSYVLNILRSENYARQYTELPLLRIRVINRKARFVLPAEVKVFRGGTSVPIAMITERLPIKETWFTVSFVGSSIGLSFVDNLQEFSISSENPIFFIQVAGDQNTLLVTSQIRITPKFSTSPFQESLLNLAIASRTATADPTLVISYRDITQFGLKIDFACDQEVFILYFFSPVYLFQEYSRTTIEAWVKRGITQIGDTQIGYIVINKEIDPETKIYANLLSDTDYKLMVYFQGPQRPTSRLSKQSDFTTLKRNFKSGIFELQFDQPIFSSRKQYMLCMLSIEYAIPTENLWTDDGVNCDLANMEVYVRRWHTTREILINETIALETAKNQAYAKNSTKTNSTDTTSTTTAATNTTSTQSSVSSDKLLEPLKFTKILVFGSKREFQPTDIYNLLFASTRDDLSIENYERIFRGLAKIVNMTNLIELHLSPAPSIIGSPTVASSVKVLNRTEIEATETKATTTTTVDTGSENVEQTVTIVEASISGISLSESGWLLAVWGNPASFGTNPTKAVLTDVSSFVGFSYAYYKKAEPIKIEIKTGLSQSTKYSAQFIAFNDDPRKNALSSAISKADFEISAAPAGSFSKIIQISIVWIGALTLLRLN